MKTKTILLTCLIFGSLHASSVKDKIKDLRKALAVHSKSEMDSWKKIEEIDKKLAALETRLAAKPLFPAYEMQQNVSQPHVNHTQCKRKMKRKLQEARRLHKAKSCMKKIKYDEQRSYFQEKAAHLNELLSNIGVYIQEKIPMTMAYAQPPLSFNNKPEVKSYPGFTPYTNTTRSTPPSARKSRRHSSHARPDKTPSRRRWRNRRPKI